MIDNWLTINWVVVRSDGDWGWWPVWFLGVGWRRAWVVMYNASWFRWGEGEGVRQVGHFRFGVFLWVRTVSYLL